MAHFLWIMRTTHEGLTNLPYLPEFVSLTYFWSNMQYEYSSKLDIKLISNNHGILKINRSSEVEATTIYVVDDLVLWSSLCRIENIAFKDSLFCISLSSENHFIYDKTWPLMDYLEEKGQSLCVTKITTKTQTHTCLRMYS